MTNSSPLQLPPPPASPGASTQRYSHSQFGARNANFMTIPQDGSQSTGTADYFLGSWLGKTVTYINEIRYFNTFRADRVPTRDRTTRTATRSGVFRVRRDGNTCWREEKIVTTIQFEAAYNEIQRYELWRINLMQESYYEFVTGLGGVAVDAAIDLPAAGAAVASERAAAAAATEGVALSAGGARLAFASRALGVAGATYLMFQVFTGAWVAWSGGTRNAAGDMRNDGWEFIRLFYADPVDEEPGRELGDGRAAVSLHGRRNGTPRDGVAPHAGDPLARGQDEVDPVEDRRRNHDRGRRDRRVLRADRRRGGTATGSDAGRNGIDDSNRGAGGNPGDLRNGGR